MHGSIARKLRIFGFDVEYNSNKEDSDLLKLAEEEQRIIITSDKGLHQVALKRRLVTVLLAEDDELGYVSKIFKHLHLSPCDLDLNNSRCSTCNGLLESVTRESLKGQIYDLTFKRYSLFYRCSSCGNIFWEGSHWQRIRIFSMNVKKKLVDMI